ncbi:MAG: hypothetical protein A2161_15005 [Candidatus Schekmanbacteria bacterium RBG_13_48_7]|uniref:Dinitrogenase iron-molybdenum cofactor biosynthesis domain-containing protein n=1 Tax=Candidatus Schekmanbacteria bacterium RBG_13_48_7 TaxID=1817878 RepID=A0A1F7RXM0_9BACT|nr:MAG: hypothetical protein A2161_15005 [Candidatus Schekmanbacteria bacterium RBG_13_48_7]
MKIGVPVWRNRVSPLFDTARTLMIIETRNGKEITRTEESLDEDFLPLRARCIKDKNIGILICGGISRALETILRFYGVVVFSGIQGDYEKVIDAFQNSRLDALEYRMPGYRGQKHQHRYRRGRMRNGFDKKNGGGKNFWGN